MKTNTITFLMAVTGTLLGSASAMAQQITGTPGAPNATTTIEGSQLPPPPQKFGGVIKESARNSKSYWPMRVVPPKGAPNVLLILTDDVGFGAPSTFGGVIPTPALDRIAKMGLRYTQFHSTAAVAYGMQGIALLPASFLHVMLAIWCLARLRSR